MHKDKYEVSLNHFFLSSVWLFKVVISPASWAECACHCGLQIGYVFWRVMRKTYMGHETRTKSVWETRFIQILGFPFWLKNTAEKMTSLQMCLIKKITPRTGQTFWDRQLCFYVKKLFVSEKTQKNELCHFSMEIYVTNFAPRA